MSTDTSSQSVYAFLQHVRRSGLLRSEEIEQFENESRGLEPPAAAQLLVERGKLSRFQARKLLQGRTRGLIIGPYQVLAPIGRGGMSTVYLARDARIAHHHDGAAHDALLALKVLPPKQAREEDRHLQRFLREMEFCRKLDHPHIARTFDVGESDGVYYIAMEFIRGRSLRRWVSLNGPLDVPGAARIFAEIADALCHAHECGVIHRDLKPSNIMVASTGQAKLLDLGLALIEGEIAEDHRVVGGQGYVVGTMDYIAPEQSEDATNVCPRSDIYGLGCTLYYVLTSRPPFPGGSAMQKIKRHRGEEPTAIERLNPSVPVPFADLVRRMMAKSPDDRPATATEVRELLLPWANKEANAHLIPQNSKSADDILNADADDSQFGSDFEFRDDGSPSAELAESLRTFWWKYGVPTLIGAVAGLILVGLFFLLSR